MINKKAIVGIFAILVILASVQGLRPVLADDGSPAPDPGTQPDPSDHGEQFYIVSVVVNGTGTVSWSGTLDGSTNTEATLNVPYGSTLTFTATGAQFTSWNIDQSSVSGNTYVLTGYGPATFADHLIIANFNQNLP